MPHIIKETRDYIGDGVYTGYDGYHIWLAVNHHENWVVAMEPEVYKRFLNYVERIKKLKK